MANPSLPLQFRAGGWGLFLWPTGRERVTQHFAWGWMDTTEVWCRLAFNPLRPIFHAQTSTTISTWELIRNADSQPLPHTYPFRFKILQVICRCIQV